MGFSDALGPRSPLGPSFTRCCEWPGPKREWAFAPWRTSSLSLRLLRPGPSLPRRFIEEKSSFEYGQVNHALAAAMRTLVKEHLVLVTQLEQLQRQGLLSLQKLWFYVQPATRTMHILASVGMCPAAQSRLRT